MRTVMLGAALAGGVCLVADLFVGADPLAWLGLVLLAVAVAVAGAGLVRARWLAFVAGAGSVALAGAVLSVLRDAAPDRELYAVVGGTATLCVAVALLRRPQSQPQPQPQQLQPQPLEPDARPGNHRS